MSSNIESILYNKKKYNENNSSKTNLINLYII